MLPQETIQAITSRVRIEDVVGEFVRLKRRGGNLMGYCPFHDGQEPTFVVDPQKNIFFCSHCRRGGDAVRFLMEREHCSREEALLWLASRYDVPHGEEAQGDELYRLSEFAQGWFSDYMWRDEMGQAVGLSYFRGRGLTDDIIRGFGLGYCPDEWTAFSDAARKRGFSERALVETGLCVRRDNGTLYDRFHGRVTFPIYSVSGRVLGFSCRILRSDKEIAKYVNSPESPIYDKGVILYGLFQARRAIQERDKCYLVEGNVDVVSMHQSGVVNCVASCGTALTSQQVRLIKQYTSKVTVVYDGDKAGVKATMRAAELLFREGMKVRMVLFPDDHDPDSYARKHGDEALRNYLETNEEDYVDYSARILGRDLANDPIRKAEAMRSMVKAIALVPDMTERNAYIQKMSSRFHNNERTMQLELQKVIEENRKKESGESRVESGAPAGNSFVPPPDDLFLPEEYQSAPGPAPQQKPLTTHHSPLTTQDEPQERKIISLLLNSGSELIEVPHEEGEPDKDYVATVIVSEILSSELSFDNPIYHTIFMEFDDFINRGELPRPDYFVNYPNEELRIEAISLMINSYHVSEKWEEKHVPVQRPEMHLKKDVVYSLLTFKLRKLDRQIADLDREMRTCRDPEEMLLLVAKKRNQLNNRKAIADQLNCVYN